MSNTAINTGSIPAKVGKANTHVIHVTDGRHANCGYNGNGRELRNVTELAPGETVTGNLCGKCFRRWDKV